jgi:hypothetical protein
MTPVQYLDDVCEPNFEDFAREPTSIRKAWASASSLFHFVDCLAIHQGKDVATVRAAMALQFPAISALADIANATKHFELRRGIRTGLSADNFRIGRGAAFSDGSYFSDGSTFSDSPDVIRVEFNGSQIDVLHLCREAITYLRSQVSP